MYKEIVMKKLGEQYPWLEDEYHLLDWLYDKVTYCLEQKLEDDSIDSSNYLFWSDIYEKVKKELEA